MTTAEILQQAGLTKYEAEAYLTLLTVGPLTGYELGKRSGVPLSRSYEVIERLVRKGLALTQPTVPPRYAAEAPDRLLGRIRREQAARLDALTTALAGLPRGGDEGGPWLLSGRAAILDRVAALVAEARRSVALAGPAGEAALTGALALAAARGCGVSATRLTAAAGESRLLFALADGELALAATLSGGDSGLAIIGRHPALVAAVGAFLAREAESTAEIRAVSTPPALEPLAWLAWEEHHKHRPLLGLGGPRAA